MIKGGYASRFEVKSFCVDAIRLLRDSKVPVLWALKTLEQDSLEAPSIVDLLKSLVSQALRLNDALHSERSMALSCTMVQRATTEVQWLEVLGSALAGIPQVYLVVDVEAVSPCLGSLDAGFSWPMAFLDFFEKMGSRGCKTVVKVILVSYCSLSFTDASSKDMQDLMISVGRSQNTSQKARCSQRGSLAIGRGFRRGRYFGA